MNKQSHQTNQLKHRTYRANRASIPQLFPTEAWEKITTLLESVCQPDAPSLSGSFYTPCPLAATVSARAFRRFFELHGRPPRSILDPACGSGVFALAAFYCLRANGVSALEAMDRIHAFDISPQAVACTRLSLRLAHWNSERATARQHTSAATHFPTIMCADTLLDDVGYDKKFDLIIGNPPFGLSRSGQITPETLARLRDRYRPLVRGKINKYMLFIARAYELLRPSGLLSLIVPNSWLGIDSGGPLRSLFQAERCDISIDRFLKRLFPGLGVEVVVLTVQRPPHRPPASALAHYQVRTFSDHTAHSPFRSDQYALPPASSMSPWPLRGGRSAQAWIESLSNSCTPLGERFQSFVGLQAYALAKGRPPQSARVVRDHPFHCSTRRSPACHPYLNGRDIGRYSVSWANSYIEFGPWLAECPPLDRFKGARILVREVLAPEPYRIQAAFTEDVFIHNRSALVVTAKSATEREATLALCALLNSRVASTLLWLRGRKTQRSLFPKIVERDLHDFLLPNNFSNRIPELASLALQSMQRASPAVDAEIEAIVLRLYGCSSSEMSEYLSQ